tara:strand:+ start:85 stop:600 length:516 start_codon:yes stop_codon:yes gene_type:complete
MAHSRIWERENSHCYYENAQLHNMILAWEPDIFEQKIKDLDHVLGIYTHNYFTINRYGRIPFMMTSDETTMSLMKLRPNMHNDNFALRDGARLKIPYQFKRKLWEGNNDLSNMLNIDAALIAAKLASFENVPYTVYEWPLAFTLPTEKVDYILNQHGVSFEDNKNILKMGI